ncbi:MAG TPA: TolC family protein [Candidatus Acidoferrales bacterium]|nr:TolC family protein [Candidatus Acidoferrales bacterium]
MTKPKLLSAMALAAFAVHGNLGAQTAGTNAPAWLTRPLSLADTLNIALTQNATILEAKSDLEVQHGLVIQTRAVALPTVKASGQYSDEEITLLPAFPGFDVQFPHQNWNSGIQLVQNIYMGGRMVAALRAADATQKQAIANYETSVADTLLNVRIAYYDVLLGAQQIVVQEASVKLLEKERQDQQHRLEAGTVPRFNLLRAEVAVANERPSLISAHNSYRIAKNNLANLLGYNLPREVWEDIPLNLVDVFDTSPYTVNLPDAIQQALSRRTELAAMRKDVELQNLNIVNAKSGYKPTVSLFGGYNWVNNEYTTDPASELNGWNAGAQVSWSLFDGLLTQGKIKQAKAQYARSKISLEDEQRQIELQVRTAYSDFIQARETLESQRKVQEEAEEALREANARAEAGTGTQLDVLDAQTSLTQARTTQIQAEHDYVAARARLERAIGADLAPLK